MKSDVKKNLWEIVKYLLTLGISAILNAVKKRRAKKSSNELIKDNSSDFVVPPCDSPPVVVDNDTAQYIQRSIDRVVKRSPRVNNDEH